MKISTKMTFDDAILICLFNPFITVKNQVIKKSAFVAIITFIYFYSIIGCHFETIVLL